MQASINQLKIALEVCETNEPINRAAGNIEQADLEVANAEDFRKAIQTLEACSSIWSQLQGNYEVGTNPEFLSETVSY